MNEYMHAWMNAWMIEWIEHTFLTKEFQVIYVDTSPSRRCRLIPLTLIMGWAMVTNFHRKEYRKGKEWLYSKEIKQTSPSFTSLVRSHVQIVLALMEMIRRIPQFVVFFLNNRDTSLVLKKTSYQPKLRKILQNTWQVVLEGSKLWRTKKDWENATD